MSTATVNEREQSILDRVPTQLFIGGAVARRHRWRHAAGRGPVDGRDDRRGARRDGRRTRSPRSTRPSPRRREFAATPPRERSEILRRAYEALVAQADDLALLMTLEMGKSVTESKAEILYAADFFNWFAGEALRIDGSYKVNDKGTGRVLVMRQPVGPCLFITPWNFPMAMGTRKIGPAIAAGCASVIKPAKQTPLSMFMLAKILEDAGLPGGALNVVTAKSSGKTMEPLIKDPRLRKLSFTGSTEVGRELMKLGAEQVLKMSMELGGNAPFIVFEDADLDAAVDGAMLAKMRNVGEACTSANRFHVARVRSPASSRASWPSAWAR